MQKISDGKVTLDFSDLPEKYSNYPDLKTKITQWQDEVVQEPSPIFANLARFMIPFDLLECFGEPVSIFLNQVQNGLKSGGKGIKLIVCKAFNFVRKIANGLKNMVKQFLGGKWAKILGGITFVALTAVAVLISFLLPAALWPVFGIVAAIGILGFLILFFCNKGRKLVQENHGVTSWKQRFELDEANRMERLLQESKTDVDNVANDTSRKAKKDMKKSWREKISSYIRDRIRRLQNDEDLVDDMSKKLPHCRTACGIDPIEPEVTRIRSVLGTTSETEWRKAFFTESYTEFSNLDDDTKKLIDFITTELYDTNADDYFNSLNDDKLYAFRYDSANLYGFWRTPDHHVALEKIIVGTRLQTLVDEGDVALEAVLRRYSTLFSIPKEYRNWRSIFCDPSATKYLDEITDILQNPLLKENYETILISLSDSFKLGKHEYILNSITDTNIRKLVEISDNHDYYFYANQWLQRAGLDVSGFPDYELTRNNYERYMRIYAKLNFDPVSDFRVQAYNEILVKTGVSDVYLITGDEAIQEVSSISIRNRNKGVDDLVIIHWLDSEGEVHLTPIIDSLKGGRYDYVLEGNIKKLTERDYYKTAIIERKIFLEDNLYAREYDVLSNYRTELWQLDDWKDYRVEYCLDSQATDAIAKMSFIPPQGGGSNLLFLTTYQTIYESSFYTSKALDELFGGIIENWDDTLYSAFVRSETEKIMVGYVKNFQMQELILTGTATKIGYFDEVIHYFDENGRLMVQTDFGGNIITSDHIKLKFVNPADGTPTEMISIEQRFLHPEVREINNKPRISWNDLPNELTQYPDLSARITELRRQIAVELEFSNYHFELPEVSIDLIERLQKEAAAMFQQRLISEGLINDINSNIYLRLVVMTNDVHPEYILDWIDETSWYYGSKPYDGIELFEDGLNAETRFRHVNNVDVSEMLEYSKRLERDELFKTIKFTPANKLSAVADPSKYRQICVEELTKAKKLFDDFSLDFLASRNPNSKRMCLALMEHMKKYEKILNIKLPNVKDGIFKWIEEIGLGRTLQQRSIALENSIYNLSVDNITNSEYKTSIYFKDEEGLFIKINGEKVGISASWQGIIKRNDNPLNQYCQSYGEYLLLPIGQTKTTSTNPLDQWDDFENEQGTISIQDLDEMRLRNSAWSVENIRIETMLFTHENNMVSFRQRNAWIQYLQHKGYPKEIIDWIKSSNLRYSPLKGDKNPTIAIKTMNILYHEYMSILREFQKWIVILLNVKDPIFEVSEECNLDINTIWENFKFNYVTGIVKAWHDGCERTYDGLKKKQIVKMCFMDLISIEYVNGTTDWSYMSEPYTIGGYSSALEQYLGELTQQGIEYILRDELSAKKFTKMCQWLIRNVFTVVGIV